MIYFWISVVPPEHHRASRDHEAGFNVAATFPGVYGKVMLGMSVDAGEAASKPCLTRR
jgi:hypothetical protein